jgi:ADP-heptose:LPS heptosyltransferase
MKEWHYRLYRYLRSPIVDAGEGDPVCQIAVKVNLGLGQVYWFKDRSLKSLCVDALDERMAMSMFPMLADGGIIATLEVTPEALKAIRKEYRYQVIKEHPFTIIKRLSGAAGEQPAPVPRPVNGRKRVLIIRYGAYGDHLMVTPLIQHYHDEGWHITYNVTERGEHIFKNDPRIDDLMVQESGVLSAERIVLNKYWEDIGKGFDKVIPLSETVEGHLLRIENTIEYHDSWEKRHADCNKNYIDYHFERAGLDIKGRLPSVWLSDAEREWAKKEVEQIRKKLGKRFIVLWNIFGSSFHKAYPWMFDVWMLLRTNRDDIGVLAVSDDAGGYVLGNEFSGTVFNGGGKYKFRQSLALHSAVDAVVTPETWSMTAALAFPAPLIALLSHSSRENVTMRDGDIFLSAPLKDCPCTPCHQLHYSKNSCPRGAFNKNTTLCMDSITPADVYDALMLLRSRHGDHASAT